MNVPETGLQRQARRAYEQGRFERAARRTLLLPPILAVSLYGCAAPGEALACAAVLLAAVTFFLWRGQGYAEGVRPGVIAGVVPLLVPALARAGGHLCAADVCLLFPALCAVGGLAGGLLLGTLAPRLRPDRPAPFLVACCVASLTGAVGCLLYGFVGIGLMAAGLAAGAVPLLATRRA
jgi:hypothetical protein